MAIRALTIHALFLNVEPHKEHVRLSGRSIIQILMIFMTSCACKVGVANTPWVIYNYTS